MSVLENKIQYQSDIKHHIEDLKTEIKKTIIDRSKDYYLCRTLNSFMSSLDIIEDLVDVDPRFYWIKIQNEMARFYKIDPTLTGFQFYLDFVYVDNTIITEHRRALLPSILINSVKKEIKDGEQVS